MTKLKYNGMVMASHIAKARVIDKKSATLLSLRQAAKVSGIDHVTLSRLQKGNAPDIDTFANVCAWLDKPMSLFFNKSTKK